MAVLFWIEFSLNRVYKYIDYDYLKGLYHQDDETIFKLLEHSCIVFPNSIEALEGALALFNVPLFMSELHKIKGGLGVIERKSLYATAVEIESKLRANEIEAGDRRIRNFLDELRHFSTEINQFLTDHNR